MKNIVKTPAVTSAVLLLSTVLAACSGQPEQRPQPEGYFATFIEQDGTKKFQYTLDIPYQSRARSNPSTGGHMAGSSSHGVSGGVSASMGGGSRYMTREQWDQLNTRLINMMERELNRSDYCKKGHVETERLVEPPTVYVRGECKDKASAADLADFPNNVD